MAFSTAVKGAGTGGKRKFDAHTWSIWANNLSKQGKHEEALSMLENAIDKNRMGTDQYLVLYNSAIDICGHVGKFGRAWKIFNDMKKRSIKPSERGTVSLLNSLAESISRRIQSEKIDEEAIWQQVLKIIGSETKEFSPYILNGLMKVCSRLESREKFEKIFPLTKPPQAADAISFTTALNFTARHGSYEDCLVLLNEMYERDLVPVENDITAILLSIRVEIMARKGKWSEEFKSLQLDRCQDVMALIDPTMIPSKKFTSVLLEVFMKLHSWKDAVKYINSRLIPLLEDSKSLKALDTHFDPYVFSLILTCLAHTGEAKETFSFFELLIAKKHHVRAEDIDALLLACKFGNLPRRADAFFRAHFYKKHGSLIPTKFTHDRLMSSLGDHKQLVDEHKEWFKQNHPDLIR